MLQNVIGFKLTTLAAVAALLALALLIFGCADDDPEPTPQPAPTAAPVDISPLANQITRLEQSLLDAMAQMQPPLSEDEIRSLIENAVSQSAPEGISGAEIQAMVDSAVAAAAAEGVNQEDVTAAIGAALAQAAANQPEPLTQADVERIVRAAVATPEPTPAPTPTPTAAPTPAPATPMAPKAPVASRLLVAISPPGSQTTMYHTQNSGSSTGVLRTIYDQLLWMDRYTEAYEPMLATGWSMSPDGKTWTFDLREGVMFHDGTEFTSKDIRRSFDVTTLESSLSYRRRTWVNWVGDSTNIDISDPYQVVFNLQVPTPFLIQDVAEASVFPILSADHWDTAGEDGYADNPIGTGPFTYAEFGVGVGLVVERFKDPDDDHWWKIPEFAEVEFQYTPEPAVRQAKLIARETHIASIPALLMQGATAAGFKRVRSTLPGMSFFFVFPLFFPEPIEFQGSSYGDNYDPEDPLNNVKVREALNIAIDREEIREVFLGDRAFLQAVHGMMPTRRAYDPAWTPYPYDPERAKALLAEAGYPDGLTIDVVVAPNMSGFPEAPDITEATLPYWNAIGVKTNFTTLDYGLVISNTQTYQYGRTLVGYRFGVGPGYISGTWSNGLFSGVPIWQDPFLLEHYKEYEQTVDADRLDALELIYGQRMYENYGTVPMFWILPEAAMDPEVVAEYEANMGNFGPVRHLEFAVPVYN